MSLEWLELELAVARLVGCGVELLALRARNYPEEPGDRNDYFDSKFGVLGPSCKGWVKGRDKEKRTDASTVDATKEMTEQREKYPRGKRFAVAGEMKTGRQTDRQTDVVWLCLR